MIRGRTIALRDVYDSDIETMTKWRNDLEINKYFFEYEPTSIERQKRWVESHRDKSDEKLFIITSLDEPIRLIGTVGLVHIDQRNQKAEWGRFLIGDSSARGKGFASEAVYLSLKYAFEHLNLQRVYLKVFSWNEAARSLYEKFGFKVEGTYRAHIYREGRFHDVTIYGLLRSEFIEDQNRIRKMLYGDERPMDMLRESAQDQEKTGLRRLNS